MSDSPAAILFDVTGTAIGTVVDGASVRLKVDARKSIALNAVRTSVPASDTDILLLDSNVSRLSCIIYNESDSPLHIGFGSTPVTLEDFTLIISGQSERELPAFSGIIRGIWQTNSVTLGLRK